MAATIASSAATRARRRSETRRRAVVIAAVGQAPHPPASARSAGAAGRAHLLGERAVAMLAQQPVDDAGAVGRAPVLRHLPLAGERAERDLDADDRAEHGLEEVG